MLILLRYYKRWNIQIYDILNVGKTRLCWSSKQIGAGRGETSHPRYLHGTLICIIALPGADPGRDVPPPVFTRYPNLNNRIRIIGGSKGCPTPVFTKGP